jgi:Ankyrin repeats (3 copies)/Ankyrin repeat
MADHALIKLLRTGRTHYDHTYTEGLNVCTQPWDDGDCTPGGFYACELRHLFRWLTLYPDIAEVAWVDVPADAQVARFATKIKATKLVLTGFMPVEDAIRLAIQEDVDPITALCWALSKASSSGHAECVRLLLAAGANVHAMDDEALREASVFGHAECVRLLLAAGANVHAMDDEALRWTSESGYTECARLLLQAGANVHASHDYALRLASYNGHTECARLLVQAGADVRAH